MSKKTGKSQNPQPQTKVKITHHSNGKAESKTAYINGERHGMESFWYESGAKWYETMWMDGEKHGMSIEWYEDGSKWSEVMWRDGKLHGMMSMWDESGQKEWEIHYIAGKTYGDIKWDEEGSVSAVTFSSQIESSNNKTNPPPKSKNTPTVNKK